MAGQVDASLGKTQLKRLEQYRDRWSSFGAGTGITELSEKPTPAVLKKYDIFKEYDDKFLEKLSPDISIARWKKDAVLFEEGSYIDVAFVVVQGTIEVFLKKQQTVDPIFDGSRTVIVPGAISDQPRGQTVFQAQVARQEAKKAGVTFLSSMDFNLPAGGAMNLGVGEVFGEIGALSGWPQSVTARTRTECELVQIRVAALRLMRRKSGALKKRLDALYRERSLMAQLKSTPVFRGIDEGFLQSLVQRVDLISCDPDEVITRQGEQADALFMVRSGFVRLAQSFGSGDIVVSYLSKGSALGEVEFLLGGGWQYTATSKEYSELVRIHKDDLREILTRYPGTEQLLWQSAVARIKESGGSRKDVRQSEFIETALEKGLVEGSSILVIDLETCTRCDDCVRGCAETHEGIPRFVREGDKVGHFLVTRACYHCQDPVCLVGCPTGAIRRTAVGAVVAIDDKLCIGCSACANNCPYDAITMFGSGEQWPADMIPEGLRGKDKQLATKCDLCYTDPGGPACVRSCPHGCATRVGSIEAFRNLFWKDR
jgi:CRP-like cAMP-binding protein/Fe-S-cluster-containing dehydrogenase component